MITIDQSNQYLEELEDELSNAPKFKVDLSTEWINTFSTKAGVYAVYQGQAMIYIGETGCIRKRMNDLRNTMNHTLRRLLGEKMFSTRSDYKRASSTQKYSPEIESELEKWMCQNLQISSIPVSLGRKELEERITSTNLQLLNKRTKRK